MIKILLTLVICFYVAFAPAYAHAQSFEDMSRDVRIRIERMEQELKKRGVSTVRSVGSSVEVSARSSYPVNITTTRPATGAVSTATVEAVRESRPLISPSAGRIAKGFATGVATNLVALALFKILEKSVDYVMDPANNQVRYKEPINPSLKTIYHNNYGSDTTDPARACESAYTEGNFVKGELTSSSPTYPYDRYNLLCIYKSNKTYSSAGYIDEPKSLEKTKSFEELAKKSISLADAGDGTAQAGMQEVVNNMITNNEIDESVYNTNIYNDNSTDVINNYVSNNFPGVSLPTQAEMANGNGSVSKTTSHDNGDGTTTNITTTTNYTTNNNTTNNTTNNTYNITNITTNSTTVNNSTTNPPATGGGDKPSSSSPASTPASTPASSPLPTDPQPFEFPEFCDWAKPVCDFIDWVKSDAPAPDDGNVTPDQDQPPDFQSPAEASYIRFDGACPAPVHIPISFMNVSRSIEISYAPVCNFAVMIKPAVLLSAWIGALMIVAGGRSRE